MHPCLARRFVGILAAVSLLIPLASCKKKSPTAPSVPVQIGVVTYHRVQVDIPDKVDNPVEVTFSRTYYTANGQEDYSGVLTKEMVRTGDADWQLSVNLSVDSGVKYYVDVNDWARGRPTVGMGSSIVAHNIFLDGKQVTNITTPGWAEGAELGRFTPLPEGGFQ